MKSDEQAIRDLIDSWLKASSAGDVPQVLGLMTDDVVFLRPGQPPMRGKESFAAGMKTGIQQFRIESKMDIQEIHVESNLAYAWNHLQIALIPLNGDAPKRHEGDILTVFRKSADGKWRLARDANMLMPVQSETLKSSTPFQPSLRDYQR